MQTHNDPLSGIDPDVNILSDVNNVMKQSEYYSVDTFNSIFVIFLNNAVIINCNIHSASKNLTSFINNFLVISTTEISLHTKCLFVSYRQLLP